MIVLNLSCDREHQFEGWFGSADAFESQRETGQITCPVCGSAVISRRPSAPYVNTGAVARAEPKAAAAPEHRGEAAPPLNPDAVATVLAMMRRIGRESEDVGERFPDEARRIHHGESEARNIKGQASGSEVRELIEEGIMVLPLPSDEGLH
ncbi:DUF1178 family protein [Azoarcus sp. KH32C]|uniref:DUF1178 family protein n=1 Tax=Azoarcus sp. KH32C TaxID=748247 RepID=UPI00023862AD|nr:DUF1178 family protein [Azoarcus sp. KH32C]BAL25129.1 hypothetical protein AZKH_2826 [Azoarcus sp. KH32C]